MLTENLAVTTVDEAEERLASPTPVLITEHEVALGTAVALRALPTTRRRWFGATQVLLAAVQRTRVPSMQDRRPARRHYGYLENASMARAMERL